MDKPIPERWRRVAGHFSETLRKLVSHRGMEAEAELIDAIGVDRLLELYAGEEPRLGEFIEAARILRVPVSTFQIYEPGAFPELELAFAELLYAASEMSPKERTQLAEAMTALPHRLGAHDCEVEGNLPELPASLLWVLRRASE